MKEQFKTHVEGHVRITDDTGKVLLDQKNAIHPGNMAIAIARGLSNSAHAQIYKLKLGNQGTYIDSSQQIVFRPPNTTGTTADLYQATYYEIVDAGSAGADAGNSVVYGPVPATISQRVIVTCVISANQAVNRPSDDASSATPTPDPSTDATLDPDGQYFFDELGLFTQGDGTFSGPYLADEADELMLSHLIFSPIEHTGSRELTLTYSLIITVT
jgi:hypothetical protein